VECLTNNTSVLMTTQITIDIQEWNFYHRGMGPISGILWDPCLDGGLQSQSECF